MLTYTDKIDIISHLYSHQKPAKLTIGNEPELEGNFKVCVFDSNDNISCMPCESDGSIIPNAAVSIFKLSDITEIRW